MFEDVEIKIKKRNKILFSRNSECIQILRGLICEQKHAAIVFWVFDCMQTPLNEFMTAYPDEKDVRNAFELCNAWARGEIKMPVAKRAILDCHAVAKRIDDEYFIALCHAIGQGCSAVHIETHALGLVFYELTAIVIKNNYKNYENEVTQKLEFYMERLKWWQDNIERFENEVRIADFLVKPRDFNKEKLLCQKTTFKEHNNQVFL